MLVNLNQQRQSAHWYLLGQDSFVYCLVQTPLSHHVSSCVSELTANNMYSTVRQQ